MAGEIIIRRAFGDGGLSKHPAVASAAISASSNAHASRNPGKSFFFLGRFDEDDDDGSPPPLRSSWATAGGPITLLTTARLTPPYAALCNLCVTIVGLQ